MACSELLHGKGSHVKTTRATYRNYDARPAMKYGSEAY